MKSLFKLNQRGQSFDVFKLLISAIVAGAILVILFSIIGGIPGIGQDAETKAIQQLKNAFNSPSKLLSVPKVTFNQDDGLNPKSIANKVQLFGRDQLCVSPGDFTERENLFKVDDLGNLTYIGGANRTTNLSIICDDGLSLASDLEALDSEDWLDACTSDWRDTCEDTTETCCIVAVKAA